MGLKVEMIELAVGRGYDTTASASRQKHRPSSWQNFIDHPETPKESIIYTSNVNDGGYYDVLYNIIVI